ncbi:tRNA wybutosine-synthesizing protein 1 [Methanomicrobium sp. W14]|jgi:tRNA wybutosine-synthesizing protein 1|uniref:4-demethylwyosine synthase TYW1 n=1 Tax=Methanomicrobium sp. W14 TaxID=2817839 RepID=UPI001AE51FFF|nr:4-demethylwyosine synthase TYW1 [Methanomicrobium sp. W14]MBP2133845.1 tRNA wybutosine-synthesizing protein 1 [Methanomicrobium sp. W14]
MQSEACKSLEKQGYQFFSKKSSAALKPCMWNKRALTGGDMCYKHKFYGISSHRCVQMTPTLKCNHRCLFCWRSMECEVKEEEECPPELIISRMHALQKKSLAGYNWILDSSTATEKLWNEALNPDMIAISLSGEPTLYSRLPELIEMLKEKGNTTFLVSNGTKPDMLSKCRPYQTYVSLDAPDRKTYLSLCNPDEDYWDDIKKSLLLLKDRRSAIRTTVVKGFNDFGAEDYADMYEMSGADFIEVKGYMFVGHSRWRLKQENMPQHSYVRDFALEISKYCGYEIIDESPVSRVVCMKRREI